MPNGQVRLRDRKGHKINEKVLTFEMEAMITDGDNTKAHLCSCEKWHRL